MQLRHVRAVSLHGSYTTHSQAVNAVMAMPTAVWMPVFVCLSEPPKWSGRPWSTRLPTARWYFPSTGWRRCWSARDFWWAFLIGSLTLVSLHLMKMQNTSSGNNDVFWIDGGHSGQLSNLSTGRTLAGFCLLFHPICQTPLLRWAGSYSEGARRKVSTRRKVVKVTQLLIQVSYIFDWLRRFRKISASQSFTTANAESLALEQ